MSGRLRLTETETLLNDEDPDNTYVGPTVERSFAFWVGGTLGVGTSIQSLIAPQNLTISSVKLAVGTAPVGASLIIDILKNGTTIFTTTAHDPTIAAGTTSATSVAPDVTNVSTGDLISLSIKQVGSTTAGSNLSVAVLCS